MRLSELMGKEIINLYDGSHLGHSGDADLVLDMTAGTIAAIILPTRGGWFSFLGRRQEIVIPWEAIQKVGSEVVVVNMDPTYSRKQGMSREFFAMTAKPGRATDAKEGKKDFTPK